MNYTQESRRLSFKSRDMIQPPKNKQYTTNTTSNHFSRVIYRARRPRAATAPKMPEPMTAVGTAPEPDEVAAREAEPEAEPETVDGRVVVPVLLPPADVVRGVVLLPAAVPLPEMTGAVVRGVPVAVADPGVVGGAVALLGSNWLMADWSSLGRADTKAG